MRHPPLRTDPACRNCGSDAPARFCPECGQETALHPPTLAEFLHEFVGHYVALEGPLWRTLGLLLLRPGRLTREYLAGRRRRYVLPLRLYLSASFLLFLTLKLMPLAPQTMHVRVGDAATASAPPASVASPAASGPGTQDCAAHGRGHCGGLDDMLQAAAVRLAEHPQEFRQQVWLHLLGIAPYAIFLLLPVFSGVMMLAYRNRGMTYGEHVVFSLHLHAFWFLGVLALALLPHAAVDTAQLVLPVYGVWAMHEAYGGRWVPTLLRAAFVSALYGALLAAVGIALALCLVVAA